MIPVWLCELIGHDWTRGGKLSDLDGIWTWRECALCHRVEVRHAAGKRRGFSFQRPWAHVLARGGLR